MITNAQVHVTHCCSKHGCKYSTPICPVVSGRLKQAYPCDVCDWELSDGGILELAYLMNEMFDKGYERGYADGEFNGSGGQLIAQPEGLPQGVYRTGEDL